MNTRIGKLILHRAYLDLKAEASQNYMGIAWWVLEPLMYMVAFYAIFEIFLQRGGPGFVGFLLCGLVFWRWFDAPVKRAGNSILGNGTLINQIYLPKLVFPLTEIAGGSLRFGIVLVLFLVFAAFYSDGPTLAWLALPALLLTQLLVIVGIGCLLSVLIPQYPDIRKFVENALLLMFYMSGIFFDTSRLGEEIQRWLNLNPMAVLIREYRNILLYGEWPNWESLAGVFVSGLILSLLGLYLLRRLDKKLAHYVN